MSDEAFILLDRGSRNILGEFESLEDARAERAEYVNTAPDAAQSLEIWNGDVQVPADPELRQTSSTASSDAGLEDEQATPSPGR